MADVVLPKISLNTADAVVVEWLVADGERVDAGDPLVEVESEKATQVIEAPEAGTVSIRADAGERIPVGGTLAVVSSGDTPAEADTTSGGPSRPVAPPSVRREARERGVDLDAIEGSGSGGRISAEDVRAAAGAEAVDGPRSTGGRRPPASPAARAAARSAGIDLDRVTGTGPEGAVVLDDVEGMEGDRQSGPTVTERRSLDGARGTIARRMTESWRDAPHVTLDRDVDVTRAVEAAAALDDGLDVPVSLTDLLIAAVSEALGRHPGVNARLEDGDHVLYAERNVAIAVDADRGLVAPVLHGTGGLTFTELVERRRALVDRATRGRLDPDDLEGGTFTVSNLGPLGVRSFTPIVNPPQVAILGVGAVRRGAVETDTGIGFRDVLTLSLSFDHRAIDGADGARFLAEVDGLLDAPASLFVE